VVGRVLSVTPTTVRFASALGETSIPRSVIRSFGEAGNAAAHGGEYWPEDPSRSRLFFAPTGRMLRQGETYFSDVYVFLPSIQGGITDQFTLGAGASIFPWVGLDEQVYYLTPKLGLYASPNVNVAVGGLFLGAAAVSDLSPVGIGYGVATFGGEDMSFTTGAGFGFSRGGTSSTAVLMLGGSTRISKSIALVSENYLTTGRSSSTLLSGGVRFMSEHLAVDLAGFGGGGTNVVIPYVAFIYKW
jgi:hypothetical protein